MRKMVAFFVVAFLLLANLIGDGHLDISYRKIGNTYIFSRIDLLNLQKQVTKYSISDIKNHYNSLDEQAKNTGNSLNRSEQKKVPIATFIHGYVTTVRESFFGDEYIVEITDGQENNISVVYPHRITQAKLNELTNYKSGDYFEALVLTRNSYYVDVPVWDAGGVYRTEP